MSRANTQILLPSILDRLIDRDPETSVEANWARSQGVAELRDAVQRDLESLLNARQVRTAELDESEQSEILASSILAYGLPDLTSLSFDDPAQQEYLRDAVYEAIRRFEPRLIDVNVILVEATQEGERRLKFIIDGRLKLDPYPEPVRYGTTVHATNGACEVRAET